MLAKFVTNASGILFSWRDNSSFRPYTLGPLCLWQCLQYKFDHFLNTGFWAPRKWHFWCPRRKKMKTVLKPVNKGKRPTESPSPLRRRGKGLVKGDYLVSCNNIADNTPELCPTHHFNRIQDIRSEDSSARARYWAVLHLGNDRKQPHFWCRQSRPVGEHSTEWFLHSQANQQPCWDSHSETQ